MSIEDFTGLNILVISPNEWGEMQLSKHHYAETLARRGNRVFFLNPPDSSAGERFQVREIEGSPNLSTVTYRPFVPYSLRFHWRRLFDTIARRHVRWLLKRIGVAFDVVWCFDLNLYSDLRWFEAPLRIFHPVDQVHLPYQIDVAKHASMVLSVSNEILDRLRAHRVPQLRIEHGVSAPFLALAERSVQAAKYVPNRPIKAGYVGNLLMPYIDREAMLDLIERRPDVEFHLWGPREPNESNVGAEGDGAGFIRNLTLHRNVHLHGPKAPSEIAEQIAEVDVLLLCYAVDRDPNHGCNSHKILEYMSTGRVIVANHVSDYSARPHLIEMMPGDRTRPLADLFDSVVNDLERYNGSSYRERRLRYVLDNSYAKQLDRISAFRNALAQSSPTDGALGNRREA